MHNYRRLVIISVLLATSLPAAAKMNPTQNAPTKNNAKNLKIFYASSPWNQDSTKVDSAFLFFREGKTGKMAKILIEETEPDSSTFQGNFSIGWSDTDSSEFEVFIPPENLRNDSKNALSKFYQLLHEKKISGKPVVFRISPEGQNILEVYDTEDQADQAKKAFAKEAELARQAELAKQALSKPIPNEAVVETAQQAERQVALDLMAQEAARREGERIRLEQIEKQRREERIKQQQRMEEKIKQNQLSKAKEFAEAALDFYRLGQFKEAEENFRQSVELDPENKEYYFKYAITLYRNEKFNEALVVMKLAATTEGMSLEKDYYMGLIHFRLKELDAAIEKFSQVEKAKDPIMSPSAAFYRGVILFNQEKFEEAKPPFEWVIDVSKDPAMDERAEDYLEKIAQMITYNKNKAKKFLVNGTIGEMYDSNVLLAPDNETSQGSTTDKDDARLIVSGGAEYRWFYGKVHELSTKLNSSYIHSSKTSLSIADPFQNTLTLPYTYKGMFAGKGYRMTVTPGYEMLNMSVESGGTKENILNSILLSVDNTFIMNERWYASYVLDVRQDDSRLDSSTGDEDADALKYSLKTTQMFFRDKSLKKAVLANFGLVNNAAQGKNKTYFRIEGGVTYMAPVRKDDSWNLGLAVYNLNYGSSTDNRKDTNVSLTLGYGHPFAEWALGNLTLNYTNNQSNVTTNQYSKYSAMATCTFNWGI